MLGLRKVIQPDFFVPVMVVVLIGIMVVNRNVLGIGALVRGGVAPSNG